MAEEYRSWSSDQLRHAMWLALPPTSAGNPAIATAASIVGVSPRSVQRWLAGDSVPSVAHTIALRAAVFPSREVLEQQQDERRWAWESAAVIGARGGRGVNDVWRQQGWHKPHLLRILKHQEWGLERPFVGLGNPAKRYYPPGGWAVVSEETFPHRPAALIAKHDKLDEVAANRVAVRADLVSSGRHECWLTSTQTVPT